MSAVRYGTIRAVPYGGLTAYVRLAFTPIIDQILSEMSEYVGQRPGAAENQNDSRFALARPTCGLLAERLAKTDCDAKMISHLRNSLLEISGIGNP